MPRHYSSTGLGVFIHAKLYTTKLYTAFVEMLPTAATDATVSCALDQLGDLSVSQQSVASHIACRSLAPALFQGHVDGAVSKGAVVTIGGKRNPDYPNGLFYLPTVSDRSRTIEDACHASPWTVGVVDSMLLPVDSLSFSAFAFSRSEGDGTERFD